MYFDDLPVGFTFETGSSTVSLEDIYEFAGKWDPQPFHIDPEAAKSSPYGRIIASGFHTITVAFVLILDSDIWTEASMGSPGMDNIRWIKPVYPGDTLRVTGEVLSAEPSASRPDRGRTRIRYKIYNQSDDQVAEFTGIHLLRRNQA
jgi:acyl dehydratase